MPNQYLAHVNKGVFRCMDTIIVMLEGWQR